MMDGKSSNKKLWTILVILGVCVLAKPPLTTASRVRNAGTIPGEPEPGTILFRDLLTGYIEHSGIYVGGGERCIVELQRDAVTHHSMIRLVTPEEFIQNGSGKRQSRSPAPWGSRERSQSPSAPPSPGPGPGSHSPRTRRYRCQR